MQRVQNKSHTKIWELLFLVSVFPVVYYSFRSNPTTTLRWISLLFKFPIQLVSLFLMSRWNGHNRQRIIAKSRENFAFFEISHSILFTFYARISFIDLNMQCTCIDLTRHMEQKNQKTMEIIDGKHTRTYKLVLR